MGTPAPVSVMVLAAGLGTRLRPLTDEQAKPMVPIGDRPAIAHVVDRVRDRLGRDVRVVVNVYHRPQDLVAWAREARAAVSVEGVLLGTAGGVARASTLLGDGDVLVWNGDILSGLDPADLVATHRALNPLATLAVKVLAQGEGNVGLDEQGRIVRLRRESFGAETRGGEFLGVHVLHARARAGLPEEGCLVGDAYLPALRRGEDLRAHVTTQPFADVGTVAAYLAANLDWLATRGESRFVGEGATVVAQATDAVVGRGARVERPIHRCVVWPGAVLGPGEPLENAVITTRGVIVPVV